VSVTLRWRPHGRSLHTDASKGDGKRVVLVKATRLAKRFDWTKEKSPLIELDVGSAVELVSIEPREGPVIEHEANLSRHRYVCRFPLGNVNALAAATGTDAGEIIATVCHPAFFLNAWLLNVPFGGARIPRPIPHVLTSSTALEVHLMGTRTWPFADPISASQFRVQSIGHRFQVPLTFDRPLAVPPIAGTLLHSFLAQTLWGHALTGSVLHNLLLHDGELYALWLGAGHGPPLLGGHVNNIVACNAMLGTWPRLARNLHEAFQLRRFWQLMQELQRLESLVTPHDLESRASALHTERALSSRLVNDLGIVHTSLGAPVRVGSLSAGGLLWLRAHLLGYDFSNIKH
jgi:hypothetical protein